MISLELVLGVFGLLVSIVALYFARRETGQKQVKELEHRLTNLESNEFTSEDRESLRDLEMKMSLFWGIVEKEFPRLLIRKHTPVIDVLLRKAHDMGVGSFTPAEQQTLLDNLDVEYIQAVESEDPGRAMAISLFRATVVYRKKQVIKQHDRTDPNNSS